VLCRSRAGSDARDTASPATNCLRIECIGHSPGRADHVYEKIAGLSLFWSEARHCFANFDLAGDLDWDALYLEFLPKVRATQSTYQYYRVMQAFAARLHDGHSGVNLPPELDQSLHAAMIRTRALADGVVAIAEVHDPSLRQQGIEPGLEIVAVDGQPVAEYAAQRVAPYKSASTPQDLAQRVHGYSLLIDLADVPVSLTLRGSDGKTFERSVPRRPIRELWPYLKGPPAVEWRMLDGGVVYLAMNTFNTSEAAERLESDFEQVRRATALILDLRRNTGGNSSEGYRVLSCLISQPVEASRWKTRESRAAERAWGQPERWYSGSHGQIEPHATLRYDGPVIVLTSATTASAAEDFLVAFDTARRGPIVGEPTCGSTGQPLLFRLPGGGAGYVCTKRDTYPDGREFVGCGVQPTHHVATTIADLRSGRDPVLEKAMELARMPRQDPGPAGPR
jgi:C-terminal processing protease CtpA/Prc